MNKPSIAWFASGGKIVDSNTGEVIVVLPSEQTKHAGLIALAPAMLHAIKEALAHELPGVVHDLLLDMVEATEGKTVYQQYTAGSVRCPRCLQVQPVSSTAWAGGVCHNSIHKHYRRQEASGGSQMELLD